MFVYDDVLSDPVAYREAVLARPFEDVTVSGICFRGIQLDQDGAFPRWIVEHFPHLRPMLSFIRRSPSGQHEPNYIHTDRDMGDWTAILYLNPRPAKGDGTMFWRHKATGAEESLTHDDHALAVEQSAWRDLTQWEPRIQVLAQFGRAVLFNAARFHSRAILENYGTGADARLVQVVFGMGTLAQKGTQAWQSVSAPL